MLGSDMKYEDFLQRMLELCEKAYQKNRIATQTKRSFCEWCCEVEKKKNPTLTLGQFLQFTVDMLVEKERDKEQEEKDKDKDKDRNKDQDQEKENYPWRTNPPPLPMPPPDRARGLCIMYVYLFFCYVKQ